MTKTSTKAEFNNFTRGLISEASPLNFPENASLDEVNFELDRDGTRSRRLGINIESGGVLKDLTNPDYPSQFLPDAFKWLDAGTLPDADFLVVQEGNTLHFFDMAVENLSDDGFKGSITLSSLPVYTKYSIDSVDGRLVVASGSDILAIVSYIGGAFSAEYYSLKTRDLWGIPVNEEQYDTDASYRGTLPINHYYNLQNQSWGIPRKNNTGVLIDPIVQYSTDLGVSPSNSEVIWTGLQFQANGGNPFERIYTNLYEEVLGADVKAAKGYFIIDVLKRGASREEEFAKNAIKYPELTNKTISVDLDKTLGGATVVKEFAGRIFYAGFSGDVEGPTDRSPNLTNHLFFTQLIKNKDDYAKCYQAGDPTSRENSDIVDTDGGFIRISEANRIIGLSVIGNSLVILATNGVWAVTGGSDYGFTATNYRVDKLTSFGCISPKSIVSDGSKVLYWSETGIYVVTPNDAGMLSASSITEKTIQRTYKDIDNGVKSTATGVYDGLTKKIRWLFRTHPLFDSSNVTYELVLDLVLGAFYLNKFYNTEDHEYELISAFDTNRYVIDEEVDDVLVGVDTVLSDTEQVVYSFESRRSAIKNVRYLFLKNVDGVLKYSFATYNNLQFKDWGETDAFAFLLTGAINATDSSAKKQVPYLLMMMRTTETNVDGSGNIAFPSGCNMRFVWDWTNNSSTGRWANPQQVYRLKREYIKLLSETSANTGYEVMVSKNKIRGQGRAFSVLFETEPEKDCQILGWNISLNAEPIT